MRTSCIVVLALMALAGCATSKEAAVSEDPLAPYRALKAKTNPAIEQKAIAAQVKQLIETNKVDRSKGEIPYSFVYRNKVKKMYLGETEKNALAAGRLAIVTLVIQNEGRRFELVPMEVAHKIAEREPETVIELNLQDESAGDADDPYAEFKIPDDLTW